MGFSGEQSPLVEATSYSSEEEVQPHVELEQDDIMPSFLPNDIIVVEKKATVASSWANLTNTILGAGMLGIPFAFAQAGTALGVFLLFFCMSMAAFGLHLLGEVSAVMEQRGIAPATYFKASLETYPWAKLIIDAAIFIKCSGVASGYLIVCGSLMPQVVSDIWPHAPDFLTTRYFWIGMSIFVVIPLAFMKNIDNLKYASIIALFSTIYLVFLIFFFYFFRRSEAQTRNANFHPPHGVVETDWWPSDALKLVPNLPIFVFAFTCHQNVHSFYESFHYLLDYLHIDSSPKKTKQLFSIYNELPNAKGIRINAVVTTSTFSCFSVYVLIGIFGYFTFGKTVNSNISANYPDTVLVTIGRIAITTNVLLSYALQYAFFFLISKASFSFPQQNNPNRAHPARNSLDAILFPKKQDLKTLLRYMIETCGIIVLTYVIAFSVKSLGVVFSVVGATGSTTICYILPGFFYWKIMEKEGLTIKRFLSLCMGIGGFLFMCLALTFIILGATGAINVQIGG